MKLETVQVQRQGAVAVITLNRPEALNAISLQAALDLREAARNVDMDADVRAVVLTATGRAFCAGGDVAAFHSALPAPEQLLKDIVLPLHDAISIFGQMDKPLLCALRGVAAGAGVGLALCGDLAIAGEGAKLQLAYTGIGASPDAGTTFLLPRLVGLHRALELALENRTLGAREMLDWGLVNAIVPDEQLDAAVLERATRLAAGPTRAFGMTRRLMRQSFEQSLDAQLQREGRGIVGVSSSGDFTEGVSAFVEKRKPTFTGK